MTGARATVVSSSSSLLSAVSYNIHQCLGSDGRRDPARIAQIIKELDADIVGLQEVHSESSETEQSRQMQYLSDATGLKFVAGPTIVKTNGEYGNVLLTRHPIIHVRRLDLSLSGREPRGALDVEIDFNNTVVRVIVSHLGLRAKERRYQAEKILNSLISDSASLLVVLIDHNEWFPIKYPVRWFHSRLGKSPYLRTFPATFPILGLDRIWVRPRKALVDVRPHVTPLTRIASDHLPVKAIVDPSRLA